MSSILRPCPQGQPLAAGELPREQQISQQQTALLGGDDELCRGDLACVRLPDHLLPARRSTRLFT